VSAAILAISSAGPAFLIGIAEPGVYLAGLTFSDGVRAILDDLPMKALRFADDVRKVFPLPDGESPLNVIFIPKGGGVEYLH
jgi:hypothetical protein